MYDLYPQTNRPLILSILFITTGWLGKQADLAPGNGGDWVD